MTKGIIYYTDNRLEDQILTAVQKQILRAGLPIVSSSLKPMDFGRNIHVDLEPGVFTMLTQILAALEASSADIVFFCEHDVLYHPSHFEFVPQGDLFYYNINVWKWPYPENRLITYDHIVSLSGLCAKRERLLEAFNARLQIVLKNGWDKEVGREPHWARRMGYEPGTKSVRQKLIQNEFAAYWRSEYPNVDIRHNKTLTKAKCSPEDFKHPPPAESWKETTLDKISGWDIKTLFNLN